ncbi:MAG: PadR family transcriptional regulator [Gemmatimonadota bacterium]
MTRSTGPDQGPLTPLSHAILLSLGRREMHGYGIMKDVEEQTEGRLRVGTGTLYAALQRMVAEGVIEGAPEIEDPEDARRRYYRITDHGREVARTESLRLARALEVARERDLGPAPGRLRPREG